tara:strand:+ start:1615 stop:1977 length:363 start_codon:yes stop_codon:yes gene_type:complete
MTDEKDCADQYLECSSECDINDPECEEECVTDLKSCDISEEFTPQDVEQCITDGTDYKDCVDHLVATMVPSKGYDEGELVSEILCIAGELDGTVTRLQTLNSVGRSSKKIVIEYDIENSK